MLRNVNIPGPLTKKLFWGVDVYFAAEHSNRRVAGLIPELDVFVIEFLQHAMVIEKWLLV